MRKLIFFSMIFSTYLFSENIYLGEFGTTYPIKEENIKKKILSGIKKNQKKFEDMAKSAFEDAMIYSINIPESTSHDISYRDLVFYAPKDIYDKDRNVIISKGEAMDIPKNMLSSAQDMCVVSFDGFHILDEIINRFGEKCKYIFVNVDIRKISHNPKYKNLSIYVGNDTFFSMFPIDKVPARISFSKDKEKIEYLDYLDIQQTVKQKLLNGDIK